MIDMYDSLTFVRENSTNSNLIKIGLRFIPCEWDTCEGKAELVVPLISGTQTPLFLLHHLQWVVSILKVTSWQPYVSGVPVITILLWVRGRRKGIYPS